MIKDLYSLIICDLLEVGVGAEVVDQIITTNILAGQAMSPQRAKYKVTGERLMTVVANHPIFYFLISIAHNIQL